MNDDCLLYILSFLDINNIVKCSLINKRFHYITHNETIWFSLFKQHFWNITCSLNYYDNFKKYYGLNKFLKCYLKSDINIRIRSNMLYFGFNKIKYLPDTICLFSHLIILDLSSNMLCSLPRTIGELVNLKELNVCHNALTCIPTTIENCGLLQIFHLDFNPLLSIPTMLKNCILLTRLWIDRSQLKLVPKGFNKNVVRIIWGY